jgi:hypothetical protein
MSGAGALTSALLAERENMDMDIEYETFEVERTLNAARLMSECLIQEYFEATACNPSTADGRAAMALTFESNRIRADILLCAIAKAQRHFNRVKEALDAAEEKARKRGEECGL